jgi:hypothetical protein
MLQSSSLDQYDTLCISYCILWKSRAGYSPQRGVPINHTSKDLSTNHPSTSKIMLFQQLRIYSRPLRVIHQLVRPIDCNSPGPIIPIPYVRISKSPHIHYRYSIPAIRLQTPHKSGLWSNASTRRALREHFPPVPTGGSRL